MTRQFDVIPAPAGGWAVKDAGSATVLRSFEKRRSAIAFARKLARKELGAPSASKSVVVHKKSTFDVALAKNGKVYVMEYKTDPGKKPTPQFGSAKGKFVLSPDFDETPEDFADYLE